MNNNLRKLRKERKLTQIALQMQTGIEQALPLTRSVALPSPFPSGMLTSASSATTVLMSGMIRTVCEVALELLPNGQALLLSEVAIEYPVRAILLSVVFTTVTLLVGSRLFRRKDIK